MVAKSISSQISAEPPRLNIQKARIEAALEASYEIECLANDFPDISVGESVRLEDEYIRRMFVSRIKQLALVVMNSIDGMEDMTTNELRLIVGLPEEKHTY